MPDNDNDNDNYDGGLVCEPSDMLHPKDWDTYSELMSKILASNPDINSTELDKAVMELMPKRKRQLHIGYASDGLDERCFIGIQADGQRAGLHLTDNELYKLIDELTRHMLFKLQQLQRQRDTRQ